MEQLDIEQLLKEGNTIRIKPQGYSMYPMLVPGRDEVLLAPVGQKTLRRGDVILYRRPGSILVLHRIVSCRGEVFLLTGDNQVALETVTPEQIRGILVGFIRNGRYIRVQNATYRLLSSIWLFLRPIRRLISVPVARFKHVFKKIQASR